MIQAGSQHLIDTSIPNLHHIDPLFGLKGMPLAQLFLHPSRDGDCAEQGLQNVKLAEVGKCDDG
jgi:hypothetical protein